MSTSSRNFSAEKANAATRVVGIIGSPVAHSLSPAMHNAEFERLGLNYVYVAFPVAPGQVATAVRGLAAAGVAGLNVTIPHKQEVLAALDEVAPEAAAIGAVNTLVISEEDGRISGYNTDVHGWLDDIQQDILLEGQRVAIIGAGGAARALAVGAHLAKAAEVVVFNRSRPNAEALAESVKQHYPEAKIAAVVLAETEAAAARDGLRECDVLVNCTPAGMGANTDLPFAADWLRPGHYVYDTVYTPAETPLLKAARALGCSTRNGLGMLARQGALAFELWTGRHPDADRMEQTLRRSRTA